MAKYKYYKLSNEIEVWKDVKNYEGYYIVSSMGKVKSLDRIVLGKNGASYFRSGKLKSSVTNKWGYLQVLLSKNNKQKLCLIHRLVAEAFIPNPENKPHIDHINTDKKDNRVGNLRWCTRSENMNNPLTKEKCREMNKGKHRSEETKKKISESGKGRILSEESKKKIGKGNGKLVYCIELDKIFESTCEASRELGISQSSISLVCRGKRKTAGGYHWEYVDSE